MGVYHWPREIYSDHHVCIPGAPCRNGANHPRGLGWIWSTKSLTADHSENHKHSHRCFMYIQMLYTVYICLHHFIWDMFTVNAGRYTISVAFGICNFTTFTRQHPAAIEHHYWADFMLPWALCLSPISMTLNEESHTQKHTHCQPLWIPTGNDDERYTFENLVTAGQHRAGYSVAVMCSANSSSARPGNCDSWIHPLNIPKLDMLFF